jgi:hypothetical protein
MFYEGAPNTGTLRLNVITAESPKPMSADAAYEELVAMKRLKAESVQRLKNETRSELRFSTAQINARR